MLAWLHFTTSSFLNRTYRMKQKIGLFYWPIFYAEIETSYAGKPFKCFFKTGEGIPFPI